MENGILTIAAGEAEAGIDLKGGTVTFFNVGENQVLFPEIEFVIAGKAKRRGGIPILFPQAGALSPDSEFDLSQHGFARDMQWNLVEKNSSRVVISLNDNEETHKVFPYSFELFLDISIKENELDYQFSVRNTSDTLLPIAPGLHPYFFIPIREKSILKTSIPDFDTQRFNWNETLVFPGQTKVEIASSKSRVEINTSANFKKLIIWSEPERDQVCIEPWVGAPDALLSSQERVEILSGESEVFTLNIKYNNNLL